MDFILNLQRSKIMSQQNINDSFIYPESEKNTILKIMRIFDFFSFIPVPKDQPVSTRRSIIGSCIFIILFLIYIGVDFYQFVMDNPPIIENAQSMLDEQFYTMPRVAITFMNGNYLNQTGNFSQYMSYYMSKQLKDKSIKKQTPITLQNNNYTYLSDWLANNTEFYTYLLSPSQQMKAKGLLYSTQNSNYTKITIYMCNVSQIDKDCESLDNITSFMAKGRIFLFIQQVQDNSGIVSKQYKPNKFRIANFFLIPRLYKRVTVEFQVINTTVLPDYFYHFTTRHFTKLEAYSISEQTSDTSINDKQRGRQSIQMLGITFQLAPQTLNVRVTYATLLDHVAKWGAFFNVLFAVFAIFFLAYNKKKFYKRNPDWDRFKNRKKSDNIIQSDFKEVQQNIYA